VAFHASQKKISNQNQKEKFYLVVFELIHFKIITSDLVEKISGKCLSLLIYSTIKQEEITKKKITKCTQSLYGFIRRFSRKEFENLFQEI
jgi:hypothetical protein